MSAAVCGTVDGLCVTRVTVRTGTAFSGTCNPETAQVSRLRRAVYGKAFRLWEWDFPLWESKTAQNHLMGNYFAGPPITHRGGGVIRTVKHKKYETTVFFVKNTVFW